MSATVDVSKFAGTVAVVHIEHGQPDEPEPTMFMVTGVPDDAVEAVCVHADVQTDAVSDVSNPTSPEPTACH